jgi:hypothetical protein
VDNSPDIGAKVSYLRTVAGIKSAVPPYVALSGPINRKRNDSAETDHMSSYPGYLGPAHDAFCLEVVGGRSAIVDTKGKELPSAKKVEVLSTTTDCGWKVEDCGEGRQEGRDAFQ